MWCNMQLATVLQHGIAVSPQACVFVIMMMAWAPTRRVGNPGDDVSIRACSTLVSCFVTRLIE